MNYKKQNKNYILLLTAYPAVCRIQREAQKKFECLLSSQLLLPIENTNSTTMKFIIYIFKLLRISKLKEKLTHILLLP